MIVDVGNDGETVVAAHSLSKEWQIVGVNISSAPQWMASPAGGEDGSGTAAAATGGGGLMLTIEGTDVGLQGAKKTENLHELVEVFNERYVCTHTLSLILLLGLVLMKGVGWRC